MKNNFFPRNRNFWLYHSLGLLAIALVEVATTLMAPHIVLFKILASLVLWPILFTFSALGFRWLYKTQGVFRRGVGRLIPLVVLYATAAAVLSTTIIALLLMPFLWHEFSSPEQIASGNVDLVQLSIPIIVSASLFGQLFITAWAFIYVFVIENRRVRESELSNLRLQHNLKEAQLSNLSSQLNPHFLFNSLNNIRFMIFENPKQADNMIIVLSDILRYSLTSHTHEKVQLEEELEITRRFVEVVKMQYEDKLTFTENISESLYACLIPPMCLQLLVENAVKHGVEHLRDGGEICVTASVKANELILSVTNPIPLKKVDSPLRNTGTGLNNIRHRLQLLYGDQANLTTKISDQSFCIEITLPNEIKE